MQSQTYKNRVLIVDFGSQLTKLIARRIRDLGVYSEITTPNKLVKLKNFDGIKGMNPIEVQRKSLATGIAAQEFGVNFYSNGAKVSGALKLNTTLIQQGSS